ncbi:hypothetical protein PF005_g31073 [Phytophthora fragariae]|uniref:Glucose-6-phosphate dehydrogenase C-terminal domain-containing protein n=2 Tax=Phytophthora TaxID=4783 RepID=A0A6A3PS86_9STRA|nr:hypothetical protein PF003_g18609 [Phytophthora fragariae]KAE8967437.1 hypothetical protein PR002_g28062 [Phytophthora rubi]KAE8918460.1 hypothetical protein PF009_g31226 [Phytophthora fragariae]KAE8960272.1 hypothetical protein PF011_g30155 [Phytophthora fragariae]KAE9059157.1 hypothetical protein PF010_g30734 [Phytophthora fragariae]
MVLGAFPSPSRTSAREYFDSYGIIRDVMQTHLLQVLSLVTHGSSSLATGKGMLYLHP